MQHRFAYILIFSFAIFLTVNSYSQNPPVDLSHIGLAGNTVSLKNHWNFHAHQFLNQDQLDTAYWETVQLPHRWDWSKWKGRPMAKKGIATYWIRLIMPEADFPMGLKFYESTSANKIFLNGNLLVETGKVGLNKEEEVPNYTNKINIIPAQFNKGDTLDIMIHLSNWNFIFGRVRKTVVIGDLATMQAQKTKRIAMDSLLLGAIALVGISQLIFFFFRRKNRYYLYLFLISLTIFLRLASVDEMLLLILYPNLPFNWLMIIRWLTTFLSVPVTMQFIYAFFPGLFNKKILIAGWILGISHSFLTLFFPFTLIIYYAYHIHVLMILGSLYVIYICFRAIKLKFHGGRTLTVGIAIATIFMINDILYVQQLSPFANFIGWGILAFFIALLTVTSKSFSAALSNEEKLTAELSELNKHLEEKVNARTHLIEEQHESLKLLLKDQETLMAMVAHDLKAPLNRAAGLAEVMSLSGELSKDQLAINKKIIEVAKSGSKLIEQLTTLQKYEQQKTEISRETMDISNQLENLLSDYIQLATDKKIQYNYQVAANILGKTNEEALTRIIDNLISNAIKFSPKLGHVYVNADNKNNNLYVTVEDSGPGFMEKDKNKLFGKFQRLSAQPTGGEGSTGLGLSIVKVMVDKLNGSIELVSKEGESAKFLVKLPLD